MSMDFVIPIETYRLALVNYLASINRGTYNDLFADWGQSYFDKEFLKELTSRTLLEAIKTIDGRISERTLGKAGGAPEDILPSGFYSIEGVFEEIFEHLFVVIGDQVGFKVEFEAKPSDFTTKVFFT